MTPPEQSTVPASRKLLATPLKIPPLIAALLTAFLLMLLFVRIPREPLTEDVDPSWGVVLQYAHTHHLQFGVDIVFTYGPLGYLAGVWYTGQAPGLRILFDVALDFTIAAGVCLLAWRTIVAWRFLLLGLFVVLPASIRPSYFDGPIETGLFCWTLQKPRRNPNR